MTKSPTEELREWLKNLDHWEPCFSTQEELISVCAILLDACEWYRRNLTIKDAPNDLGTLARNAIAEAEKVVRGE